MSAAGPANGQLNRRWLELGTRPAAAAATPVEQEFDGVTLSTDPAVTRRELLNVLARDERGGLAGLRGFVFAFRLGADRAPSTSILPVVERVAAELDAQYTRERDAFEALVAQETRRLLDRSRARILAERERYGLRRSSTSLPRDPERQTRQTDTTHDMANNDATRELAQAASVLIDAIQNVERARAGITPTPPIVQVFRAMSGQSQLLGRSQALVARTPAAPAGRELDGMSVGIDFSRLFSPRHDPREALPMRIDGRSPADGRASLLFPLDREESDFQRNTARLQMAEREYEFTRQGIEARHPMLAAFRGTDSLASLRQIAAGPSEGNAELLFSTGEERLANIDSVRSAIGGRFQPIMEPRLVALARQTRPGPPDPALDRVVRERVEQIHSDEAWWATVTAVVSFAIASIAIVGSMGLLAPEVGATATLLGTGIGLNQTAQSLAEYQLESSASNTDFAPELSASERTPSLWSTGFDVLASAFDVMGAGAPLRELSAAIRTARATRALDALAATARAQFHALPAELRAATNEAAFVEQVLATARQPAGAGELEFLAHHPVGLPASGVLSEAAATGRPGLIAVVPVNEVHSISVIRANDRVVLRICSPSCGPLHTTLVELEHHAGHEASEIRGILHDLEDVEATFGATPVDPAGQARLQRLAERVEVLRTRVGEAQFFGEFDLATRIRSGADVDEQLLRERRDQLRSLSSLTDVEQARLELVEHRLTLYDISMAQPTSDGIFLDYGSRPRTTTPEFGNVDLDSMAPATNTRSGPRPDLDDASMRANASRVPEQNTFGPASSVRGGTEARSGMFFHEYNAAEVANRLRIDYDPVAGRPRSISYRIDASAARARPQSPRTFTYDPATGGMQPDPVAFSGTGFDLGHGAQREAFRGDIDVELAVDQMTGVVPQAAASNRGRGSPWRQSERNAMAWAQTFGSVDVHTEFIYAANPPRLADGTPIPLAIRRRITAPDGTVLEDISHLNR
ncbi:DNA/RNA non-specific endonuclease [Nannocystaceae bacterium ST9]